MHPIASQNYSFGSLKSPCANDPNFLALTASPIYQQEPLYLTAFSIVHIAKIDVSFQLQERFDFS